MRKLFLLGLMVVACFAEMMRLDAKEIVYDTASKLFWQDNAESKTLQKEWKEAMEYCNNLSLAGFDDWQLPSRSTLLMLTSDKKILKNVAPEAYWTSTPSANSLTSAWNVFFEGDYEHRDDKTKKYHVRCVRNEEMSR